MRAFFVSSSHLSFLLPAICVLHLSACGPEGSGNGGTDAGSGESDATDDPFPECVATAEVENCESDADDDCDGNFNCSDSDCEDSPACQCGEAETPEASLRLPDGTGASYETSFSFQGFEEGAVLENVSDLLGTCAIMEHSWYHDLDIEIECPNGQKVIILDQNFIVKIVHMGVPFEADDDTEPVNFAPGEGWEYCWRPDASLDTMDAVADSLPSVGIEPDDGRDIYRLPAQDYGPDGDFADLLGCPLNGEWKLRVIDQWALDNGTISKWTLQFSDDLIPDCDDFVID